MSFLGGVFGSPRDRFGKKILEQVRGYEVVEFARFDPEAFEIACRLRNGYAATLKLEMLYRRFGGKVGAELFAVIDSMLLPPAARESWDEVSPKLRPVVRRAGYGAVRVAEADSRDMVLTRPALPYLCELVVIDLPSTVQFVTRQDLSRWGVDEEQVYAVAHANLTELAMSTMTAFDQAEGVRVLDFTDDDGENYVGSLPLVAGWLAGVGARTGTTPLLFLPGHLGMLVVLGATPAAMPQLLALASERHEAALRPLSAVPYTVDDNGDLTPLRVPEDHPAYAEIRHAQAQLVVGAYRSQTENLREEDDREGAIMELLLVSAPDGSEYTMTSWTDGATNLLPAADFICFVTGDGDVFRVAWDDVSGLVPLELADEYDPPRFRVQDHPPAEVMARLRALAR
ncbi:hypothetical protein ACQP06_25000 [Nocardia sp. CA-136227]|uniref:hypothetical protein n=1 Tax=Nocardia sp. CA-136227 TaxID=3239979 RepID=UPI003D968184